MKHNPWGCLLCPTLGWLYVAKKHSTTSLIESTFKIPWDLLILHYDCKIQYKIQTKIGTRVTQVADSHPDFCTFNNETSKCMLEVHFG